MKTTTLMIKPFAFLKRAACIAVCVMCYVGAAHAADPAPRTIPNKNVDLVLTLPKHWQPTDTTQLSGRQKTARQSRDIFKEPSSAPNTPPQLNVGCDIGVNETLLVSSSLTGRMGGNCNVNYHY